MGKAHTTIKLESTTAEVWQQYFSIKKDEIGKADHNITDVIKELKELKDALNPTIKFFQQKPVESSEKQPKKKISKKTELESMIEEQNRIIEQKALLKIKGG